MLCNGVEALRNLSPDAQVLLGLLVRSSLNFGLGSPLRFPRPEFEEPGQALGTNKKFAFANFLPSPSFWCHRRDSYLIHVIIFILTRRKLDIRYSHCGAYSLYSNVSVPRYLPKKTHEQNRFLAYVCHKF